MLAGAGDDEFMSTRLLFAAGVWCMTAFFVGMTASFLGFATRLVAWSMTILTFSRFMARFAACVRAAFQLSPADLTAAYVGEPALLILEALLATETRFLGEVRAFRARVFIGVAVVRHLSMTASFSSFAVESAWWRLGTAWQWRLKHRASTVAADLVENGFSAASALSFVAKLLTQVVPALEQTSAGSCANVLGFKAIVNGTSRVQGARFALVC